jgi:2-polyprenyl-3-methyl-5-hydroxy-6-metoxy-1,4-benzoquinol methylase
MQELMVSSAGIQMSSAPSANLTSSRYEYALQSIQRVRSSLPSNVVFDVGAGDGRMKERIEASDLRYYGFDLIPFSPEIIAWDLTAPCPMKSRVASVVMLLDVIEHLVNPGLALSNIFEVLQPYGRLVLTMPNPRWSRSRIHALFHGNPACFTQSDLDLNNHVFTPWPHILIKMLHDAKFELEDYVTLNGKTMWPGRPISFRYPLRCMHALANMFIERLDASACGMSYGLVARVQK